jgi:hypothetical protein
MADDEQPANVDDLYAVAPDEFVAARKELVRRLKAAGDTEGATLAGQARKPPRSAWALNVAATSEPESVAAFVASIDDLAAALGGDGDPRTAMSAHRDATEALLDAAERVSGVEGESWRSRMRGTLQAAATDADVAAELVAGTLRDDAAPSGLGPLGMPDPGADVVSLASRRAARRRSAATSDGPAAEVHDAPVPTRRERERAERQRREEAAADRRRQRLRSDLAERTAVADRLEAEADRLATAADRARRAADEARDAADAARARVRDLRRQLEDLEGGTGG